MKTMPINYIHRTRYPAKRKGPVNIMDLTFWNLAIGIASFVGVIGYCFYRLFTPLGDPKDKEYTSTYYDGYEIPAKKKRGA